jgi:hypothetical protein
MIFVICVGQHYFLYFLTFAYIPVHSLPSHIILDRFVVTNCASHANFGSEERREQTRRSEELASIAIYVIHQYFQYTTRQGRLHSTRIANPLRCSSSYLILSYLIFDQPDICLLRSILFCIVQFCSVPRTIRLGLQPVQCWERRSPSSCWRHTRHIMI